MLSALSIIVLTLILVLTINNLITIGSSLQITADSEQEFYNIRETVKIYGNILKDGTPGSNCLISIEVRNQRGDTFIYRTVPIGNPSETWNVEIKDAYMTNWGGDPTNSAAILTMARLYVTIQNKLLNSINVVVTVTLLDGTSIPIYADYAQVQLSANQTMTSSWSVFIPEWAYSGKAVAYFNVYSDLPKNRGTPYTPERMLELFITRNPELKNPYSILPPTYNTTPGSYEIFFRIPPDRYTLPGTYDVYVTAFFDPLTKGFTTTTFQVEQYACSPQACFTYTPLKILANMTVTLDASSSSAEGYNDTIICYEWTINDPYKPEHIVKQGTFTNPPPPTVKHAFAYSGTYVVELNVTDNEGLWSTTSKPIRIDPEFGPTANFTWAPKTPIINQTVAFDASNSTLGWSAQIAGYSPITSYAWNFSDGTVITITDKMINHQFGQPGNFSVKLTVTDSVGRTNSISQTVQVLNMTAKLYDLNGDKKIDMKDIAIVARAYGSNPSKPNWNPIADINGDGKVDMKDVAPVARHFGEDP
jgi:chitodextrinase